MRRVLITLSLIWLVLVSWAIEAAVEDILFDDPPFHGMPGGVRAVALGMFVIVLVGLWFVVGVTPLGLALESDSKKPSSGRRS